MNDVCFILLILILIIMISRNSDTENFDNDEIINLEEEETNQELPEAVEAPKKLKNSSENAPTKEQQLLNQQKVHGDHLDFNISGYEEGNMFASYEDNYGDIVPFSMQSDYAILKEKNIIRPNLMGNIEEERSPGYISDSQAPSFDPTAKTGLMAVGQIDEDKEVTNGKPSKTVEVHFVYAEWCGHSQNAIPAFEELTKINDVKTQSGTSVTFVMTEEQSDGFSVFKGKVQGFPTYMTVVKENEEIKSIDELLVQNRTKEGIIEATKELV